MGNLNLLKSQKLIYDSINIKIKSLEKVNTPATEYAPFKFNDKFYFISDKENEFATKHFDKKTNKEFSKLYACGYTDTLKFSNPHNSLGLINAKNNAGPICETNKGIYFTLNNEKHKANGNIKNNTLPLEIVFAEKINRSDLAKTQKIDFGMYDSLSFGHPTVINDSLMYFTGELKNGFGNSDLYYSIKKNNVWQSPINCGAEINSPYNESFPFLIRSKLYFTSDRPGGFGGFDIYCIDIENKELGLQLLEYPINSAYDDFSIYVEANLSHGFFSSNRKGNVDIYYFNYTIPKLNGCNEMKNNIYCYTFFEETSLNSKDTVGMTYEWNFGDGAKKRGLEVKHCFDGQGVYLVELNVIDKLSGEIFYNEVNYEFDLKNEKQIFIHCPDTVKTGYEIVFDPRYTNLDSLIITNYYWDFGDGMFSYNKKVNHKFTAPGIYEIKLGISGIVNAKVFKECVAKKIKVTTANIKPFYSFNPPKINVPPTDYRKKFADSMLVYDKPFYNFLIAKQKADSVEMLKLSQAGKAKKSANQALAKTRPLIDKNDPNKKVFNLYRAGANDSSITYKVHLGVSKDKMEMNDPAFRGLNQISETNSNNMYHYFYGDAKFLSEIIPYYEQAKEEGFNSAVVVSFKNDTMINNPNARTQYKMAKDTLMSQKFTTIYFDRNSYKITSEEKIKLKSFLNGFNNLSKMKVILKGYADYTGNSKANDILSKKRVKEVESELFLLRKIKVKLYYFGDSKSSKSDDFENLKRNRKVEIIVVKKT